jgi:hypothetical protein
MRGIKFRAWDISSNLEFYEIAGNIYENKDLLNG